MFSNLPLKLVISWEYIPWAWAVNMCRQEILQFNAQLSTLQPNIIFKVIIITFVLKTYYCSSTVDKKKSVNKIIMDMNKFFESNPGLKSRFNTFIEFDDYNSTELDKILLSMCKNNDYVLDDEAKEKIHLYFEQQTVSKDENFANGRLVRNLYDDLVMNHARRVINTANPGSEELSTIKAVDFIFTTKNGCNDN